MTTQTRESWHLSKSVPVSLILTLLVQTAAIVWFLSTLSAQVETNRTDIVRHDTLIGRMAQDSQRQDVTLGRIEENVKEIRRLLTSGN